LISNAYQAAKEKGTLSLGVYPFSKNGSSYIRVEVENTGGGIDPENLHNIFNPFYTTKDAHLGLGLPIVHKIITSHRGQIEVNNHPGEGVAFIVTLPAKQSTPPPLTGGDSGEGERAKNGP
jgi:signal transduction histidine kinase